MKWKNFQKLKISFLGISLVYSAFAYSALTRPSRGLTGDVGVKKPVSSKTRYEYGGVVFDIIDERNSNIDVQAIAHKINHLLGDFSKENFGQSLIKEEKLHFIININNRVLSNGTKPIFGNYIDITIGHDVHDGLIKTVVDSIAAHEAGHVLFHAFSGFNPGYARVPDFFRGGEVEALSQSLQQTPPTKEALKKYRNLTALFSGYDELFADVTAFYVTGVPDQDAYLKGPEYSFLRKTALSEELLEDHYRFFGPAREKIYQRHTASKGDLRDLALMYSAFTHEMQGLVDSDPRVFSQINLDLLSKMVEQMDSAMLNLSSYPLPKSLQANCFEILSTAGKR